MQHSACHIQLSAGENKNVDPVKHLHIKKTFTIEKQFNDLYLHLE